MCNISSDMKLQLYQLDKSTFFIECDTGEGWGDVLNKEGVFNSCQWLHQTLLNKGALITPIKDVAFE